jgi:hypothetical protein
MPNRKILPRADNHRSIAMPLRVSVPCARYVSSNTMLRWNLLRCRGDSRLHMFFGLVLPGRFFRRNAVPCSVLLCINDSRAVALRHWNVLSTIFDFAGPMHGWLLLRARNGHRDPVSRRLAMSAAICIPNTVLGGIFLRCRVISTVCLQRRLLLPRRIWFQHSLPGRFILCDNNAGASAVQSWILLPRVFHCADAMHDRKLLPCRIFRPNPMPCRILLPWRVAAYYVHSRKLLPCIICIADTVQCSKHVLRPGLERERALSLRVILPDIVDHRDMPGRARVRRRAIRRVRGRKLLPTRVWNRVRLSRWLVLQIYRFKDNMPTWKQMPCAQYGTCAVCPRVLLS